MGTSNIFFPYTKNTSERNLELRFSHRFGNAKSGFNEFYGLDQGANSNIALDYGISDSLSIGLNRTSENKIYEVRSKYNLLDEDSFPVAISLFGVVGQQTSEQSIRFNFFNQPITGVSSIDTEINRRLNEYRLSDEDKRSYLGSVLFSSKVTDRFSIQVAPVYIHKNFTKSNIDNNRRGIEIGGRFRLTDNLDISFDSLFSEKRDYFGESYETERLRTSVQGIQKYTADEINAKLQSGQTTIDEVVIRNVFLSRDIKYRYIPFALGLNYDSGGHIFQCFVSNQRSIAHTTLFEGADFDLFKREFIFGFNILRNFSLDDRY